MYHGAVKVLKFLLSNCVGPLTVEDAFWSEAMDYQNERPEGSMGNIASRIEYCTSHAEIEGQSHPKNT